MDNSKNKTPRKAHDINTKIEEESLWDLDDDWEGVDDEDPSPSEAAETEHASDVEEATDENEPADVTAEIEDEPTDDSSREQETEEKPEEGNDEQEDEITETVENSQDGPIEDSNEELEIETEKAPLGDNDEFDFDEGNEEEEEDLNTSALETPEEEAPEQPEEELEESDQSDPIDSYDEFDDLDAVESGEPQSEDTDEIIDTDGATDDSDHDALESTETAEEVTEEVTEEAPDEPSPETNQLEALVEPLKKLSLSTTEKIALSAVAAIFIGLLIYSYSWLQGKNNESVEEELKFPIKGEYATISDFSTYWKTPGKAPGIKLGAEVVPAASITLDDSSSSGALRVFFRNATNDRIGDTITVKFTNGKFANGSNTIDVSASDGFHLKGDFHAYQMDRSLAWKVYVLEAASSSASGTDYKELVETNVAPVMQ